MEIKGKINGKVFTEPDALNNEKLKRTFMLIKPVVEEMARRDEKNITEIYGRKPEIKNIYITMSPSKRDIRIVRIDEDNMFINWQILLRKIKNGDIMPSLNIPFTLSILRNTSLGINLSNIENELSKNREYDNNFNSVIMNRKDSEEIMQHLLQKYAPKVKVGMSLEINFSSSVVLSPQNAADPEVKITTQTHPEFTIDLDSKKLETMLCYSLTLHGLLLYPDRYISEQNAFVSDMNRIAKQTELIKHSKPEDEDIIKKFQNVYTPPIMFVIFGPHAYMVPIEEMRLRLLNAATRFVLQVREVLDGNTIEMFNLLTDRPPENYMDILHPKAYIDSIRQS